MFLIQKYLIRVICSPGLKKEFNSAYKEFYKRLPWKYIIYKKGTTIVVLDDASKTKQVKDIKVESRKVLLTKCVLGSIISVEQSGDVAARLNSRYRKNNICVHVPQIWDRKV